jgi:DNA-binding response OmpR family regulator
MTHILIVESALFLGRVVGLTLLDAGFQVALVKEPEDVLERLQENPPQLIVFNTGLPAEAKSAFIRSWREQAPDVKVLEISENPLIIASPSSSLDVGRADRYLTTPFRWERLPDVVRECLGEPPDSASA